jgi:putative FmdB family regulatory protein
MIISDFECSQCGETTELMVERGDKFAPCPECGARAKRVISFGKVNMVNENPAWLKSVIDVVDKGNPAHHVQEFIKNPSRRSYKAWMKGEGIRPLDHSEKGGPPQHRPPPDPDLTRHMKEVTRRHFERKRVEVR